MAIFRMTTSAVLLITIASRLFDYLGEQFMNGAGTE